MLMLFGSSQGATWCRQSYSAIRLPGFKQAQYRSCKRHTRHHACVHAQQLQQQAASFSQQQWQQQAPAILQRIGLQQQATPQQLWQHIADLHDNQQPPPPQQPQQQEDVQAKQQQQQQQQGVLAQALDLDSCRLLLAAASATCSSQQQLNQLRGLIHAATACFPSFELGDFRVLLQLCAQARYIPHKEWLAAIIYADTGGFERLYKEEPAHSVVQLFSDLSAMLASHKPLYLDWQLSKQQQAFQTSESTAELDALQAALTVSGPNLMGIQQDSLLAGELSAVGGYWLLRRLLPQLQVDGNAAAVLQGVMALPGLSYQVLDAEDADVLLQLLALQQQSWDPNQLAAALTASLPCLAETAPSSGDALAVLFAAVGAAAGGMGQQQAGQLLVVLAQLPGYAPDPKVAQALLDRSFAPPLALSPPQLLQLMTAAQELGAGARPEQLPLLLQQAS